MAQYRDPGIAVTDAGGEPELESLFVEPAASSPPGAPANPPTEATEANALTRKLIGYTVYIRQKERNP